MRIIWKQWGQQRFSYWLNNKVNLSTDNSNIRVVIEFWFRFVFGQVLELAADVLKKVPEEIDYEQTAKIMSDDPSPLNVVLLQEVRNIIYTTWYARKILQLSSAFTWTQTTKLKLPDDWHRPELRTSSKIHSVQFTKLFILYANMLLWPVAFIWPLRLDMSRNASCWDACSLWYISITKCPHSKKHEVIRKWHSVMLFIKSMHLSSVQPWTCV